MFGKKKKNKKDKSLNSESEETSKSQEETEQTPENPSNLDDDSDLYDIEDEVELTESQKQKKEKLDSVKSKISKILKSKDIEIVDENTGDEYEDDETTESEKQKQADYESLKEIYGKDEKNKKKELTLTIDDFDYTYVGKYVDEYDMMHRKNIKRIKLPSKFAKVFKRIAIAAVIIGILIGAIVFVVNMKAEPVYYLSSVSLSQSEQSYFVNERFDYTGLYLYVTYTNGKNSYTQTIDLSSNYYYASISRGAFTADSRNNITFNSGTEAYIGFNYGGLTCMMKINIKTKNKESITVKYTNGLFSLKSGDILSSKNLFALVDYSNYNSELISYYDLDIKVDGVSLSYNKDSNGFIVGNDITTESEIVVSYDNYTVTLVYVEGAVGISYVCSSD